MYYITCIKFPYCSSCHFSILNENLDAIAGISFPVAGLYGWQKWYLTSSLWLVREHDQKNVLVQLTTLNNGWGLEQHRALPPQGRRVPGGVYCGERGWGRWGGHSVHQLGLHINFLTDWFTVLQCLPATHSWCAHLLLWAAGTRHGYHTVLHPSPGRRLCWQWPTRHVLGSASRNTSTRQAEHLCFCCPLSQVSGWCHCQDRHGVGGKERWVQVPLYIFCQTWWRIWEYMEKSSLNFGLQKGCRS